MNLSFQTSNSYGTRKLNSNPICNNSNNNARNNLAKVLFGKSLPASSAISFGWSSNLPKIETEILDILTDPNNKDVVICSHSFPDGDAYGSNIGSAGILESLGKKTHSIINSPPKKSFQYVPSPNPSKTATDYIQSLDGLNSVKNTDVAIFTDASEPNMLKGSRNETNNNTLDTIISKQPKKIIIIDHHPDEKGEPTNKDKWSKELNIRGIPNNNILYWRESRASASEMIAEMDKELVTESSKRKISGYNPRFYHPYRLATATGILTDAGGTTTGKGEIDNTKFARLSPEKVTTTEGKQVSKTRDAFEWLINNSNVAKSKIDSTELINMLQIEPKITSKVRGIIDGKVKVDGIDVKVPTKNDPLGYIYVHKGWAALEKIAKEDDTPITDALFILKMFKIQMSEKLMNDKNAGLYILANTGKDDKTFLTMRSYGFDSLNGELHEKGHVFCNALVSKVMSKIEPMHGEGGGHKNAGSFKSNKRVDFYQQLMPFIKDAINEYKKENPDLTKEPAEKPTEIENVSEAS